MHAPKPLSPRRARLVRTALFAAAALLGLISALGWRFQRPWPNPAHPPRGLAWLFAPIETNAWMRLGARGSGFQTGPAYSPHDAPQRSPIEDLAVTDGRVFVAFNDGTIVRGDPGRRGASWQQARLDVPRGPGPVSLAFLGSLEGYAVAGTGAVFRTSDGGESWQRIRTNESLPPLLAIGAYAAGAPVLWALAENEALWSRDGGRTWIQLSLEEAIQEASAPGGAGTEEAYQQAPRHASPIPRTWFLAQAPKPPEAKDPARVKRPAEQQRDSSEGPRRAAEPQPAGWSSARHSPNAPAPQPEPRPPPRAEERARPPPGPYQVCATPRETWFITPRGAFTFYSEAGRDVLQRAVVGTGLVRCVRHRLDVVALIDGEGGSWRRRTGSESWRRFEEPRVSDLAVLDGDAPGHFAVGPNGHAASWPERGAAAPAFPWHRDLRRIGVAGQEAWVLDGDDGLWRAERLGGPWRRAIAFRSSITAAAEPEQGVLLAATSTGMLLRSDDRGVSWSVEGAFDRPIAALAQTSWGRWAAIAPGSPPRKGWQEPAERGEPWLEAPALESVFAAPHPDGSLTYPPINDFEQALVASSLLGTRVPPALLEGAGVTALFMPSGEGPGTVWGVGRGGRIVRALTYSVVEDRPAPGAVNLRDIAVVGSEGWAVGDHGTVLRSSDGGKSWSRVTSPTQAALTSVLVSERGARVAVFGDGDTIRVTDDGGRSWRAPVNRLYPAPWCLAFCALALALGAAGARVKVPAEVVGAHIEDLLASDAPITDERQDVLGQGEVARTIAYFLQNDRTEAPLTLAVTGEWGTGKSSVLNLVRAGLKRAGMPVINFNAWHHQQDSEPLASLYSLIVDGALPRGLARVEFRLRLLATRWRKRAWMLAVLALLTTFLLGLYARAPHYSDDALRQISPLVQCVFGANCPPPEAKSPAPSADSSGQLSEHSGHSGHANTFWGGGLATLLVAVPLLTSLLRSLRSFGVNPGALVSAVSGGLRGGAVEKERVSFHARFAAEFADVTAALGRRRLVLMIDDLDRCSPANLLKVLEAMDFLVSSGRCFVVLAMSRSVVLGNLASELRRPPNDAGSPLEAADRYLQKLINVEVALPPLLPARGLSLITRAERPPPGAAERSAVSRAAGWGLAAGVALALGALSYQGGARLGVMAESDLARAEAAELPEEALATAAAAPASSSSSRAANLGKSDKRAAAPPPLVEAAPVRLPERWSIAAPAPPRRSPWAFIPWVVLVAAGLLALAVTSSPRPMTTDSRDFREALERWAAVIQLHLGTPRALKRFLNRLRFWAMRLRAEREPVIPVSPWRRLFSLGPQARGRPDVMLEPSLVALAALHEARPELILRADLFAKALQGDPGGDQDQQLILQALSAERERTGGPSEQDRQRFVELLGTVQMRT